MVGVIALIVGIVALIAAAASAQSTAQTDHDQLAHDTAETTRLMKKLEDDAREVDAHIASVLAKISKGDRNGQP